MAKESTQTTYNTPTEAEVAHAANVPALESKTRKQAIASLRHQKSDGPVYVKHGDTFVEIGTATVITKGNALYVSVKAFVNLTEVQDGHSVPYPNDMDFSNIVASMTDGKAVKRTVKKVELSDTATKALEDAKEAIARLQASLPSGYKLDSTGKLIKSRVRKEKTATVTA